MDGSYIWVSDIGKKSWDEKGVPICIGVVRDITDEVVMKRRLEQESLQRQRQAEEYSHIFNSVFCGIVQYRMDRPVSYTHLNGHLWEICFLNNIFSNLCCFLEAV